MTTHPILAAALTLAVGATLLPACDGLPQREDEAVEVRNPAPPPADELEASLRELGRERAPYMLVHGPALRGEMQQGEVRDFSHVMLPGWCYKVLGIGGEGVEDLDLRLYTPNEALLQRDTTQDGQPYLGRMRPICPPRAGSFRIQVRMTAGSGPFVVQVYRSI